MHVAKLNFQTRALCRGLLHDKGKGNEKEKKGREEGKEGNEGMVRDRTSQNKFMVTALKKIQFNTVIG